MKTILYSSKESLNDLITLYGRSASKDIEDRWTIIHSSQVLDPSEDEEFEIEEELNIPKPVRVNISSLQHRVYIGSPV
jgi:hypothetical protein